MTDTRILEDLGYRVTGDGYENKKERISVLRVERIGDGTTSPFAFCMHTGKNIGFILPEPFLFYERRIRRCIAQQEAR